MFFPQTKSLFPPPNQRNFESRQRKFATCPLPQHVKNVDSVILGYHTFHQIAAWYYSPYPHHPLAIIEGMTM